MAQAAGAVAVAAQQGTARGAGTLIDVFQRRVERSGNRTALRHKADGQWKGVTWQEWGVASREIAAGLLELGVNPGDRVALLAETRVEWPMFDTGVLQAGAVVVPIYPSSTPEQCEHILRDSGAVAV